MTWHSLNPYGIYLGNRQKIYKKEGNILDHGRKQSSGFHRIFTVAFDYFRLSKC